MARRLIITVSLKVLAVALGDFLLVGLLAPNLVDAHQDLALAGAIACVVLALAITAWLALKLISDARRFSAAWRQLLVARSLEQDPP